MKKILLLCLLATGLSGCGLLYRVDVQQGNVITREMLAQLKLGMAEKQVRYIMGNPLAISLFHQRPENQRWDYYYSYAKGWKKPQTRHLILHLENGILTKVEGEIDQPVGTLPEVTPGRGGEDTPIL